MRRTDTAEWILSLATSPDRAHSIAGDLAEQAPLRGAGWFWGSLARTAASLTWRAFTDAPLRMTAMAFLGLILCLFWMLVTMLGLVIFHMILIVTTGWGSLEIYLKEEQPSDWTWLLQSMAAFLITSFLFGRWLAKRVPQRELVVYAIVWFISQTLWIPMFLLTGETLPRPGLPDLLMTIPSTVLGVFFTLAGVRQVRRASTVL